MTHALGICIAGHKTWSLDPGHPSPSAALLRCPAIQGFASTAVPVFTGTELPSVKRAPNCKIAAQYEAIEPRTIVVIAIYPRVELYGPSSKCSDLLKQKVNTLRLCVDWYIPVLGRVARHDR
jgi:hypothetical protein